MTVHKISKMQREHNRIVKRRIIIGIGFAVYVVFFGAHDMTILIHEFTVATLGAAAADMIISLS